MKKYKSSAEIKLSFRGNSMDLNFISEILNLTPSKLYKNGDYIENFGKAKTNLWEYEFAKCNAYEEIDFNIIKLINYLLTKDYKKIRKNSKIHEKLICIIIMKEKYDDIGIDLNVEELGKLKMLGLGLSLSVYDL